MHNEMRSGTDEVFVAYDELKNEGIRYCRLHLRRLVKRGQFPSPVKLSPNRIAWRRSDIVAWVASRPSAYAEGSADAAA